MNKYITAAMLLGIPALLIYLKVRQLRAFYRGMMIQEAARNRERDTLNAAERRRQNVAELREQRELAWAEAREQEQEQAQAGDTEPRPWETMGVKELMIVDPENEFKDFECALSTKLRLVPYEFQPMEPNRSIRQSMEFYEKMSRRQPIHIFSHKNIPKEVIHNLIKTAGTAPSVAHTQPWIFIVVSNKNLKQKIRDIIEQDEKIKLEKKRLEEIKLEEKMSKKQPEQKKHLKKKLPNIIVPEATWRKEYLTSAPYLILVFKRMFDITPEGPLRIHYYNEKSVAIASGILLNAIHMSGLVTAASAPMECAPALRKLLKRPRTERFSLLLPVGYPGQGVTVPKWQRNNVQKILMMVKGKLKTDTKTSPERTAVLV